MPALTTDSAAAPKNFVAAAAVVAVAAIFDDAVNEFRSMKPGDSRRKTPPIYKAHRENET